MGLDIVQGSDMADFTAWAASEDGPSPLLVHKCKPEEHRFQPLDIGAVDKPWRVVGRYKWKRIESIPVLEGRAALFAVKHKLRELCVWLRGVLFTIGGCLRSGILLMPLLEDQNFQLLGRPFFCMVIHRQMQSPTAPSKPRTVQKQRKTKVSKSAVTAQKRSWFGIESRSCNKSVHWRWHRWGHGVEWNITNVGNDSFRIQAWEWQRSWRYNRWIGLYQSCWNQCSWRDLSQAQYMMAAVLFNLPWSQQRDPVCRTPFAVGSSLRHFWHTAKSKAKSRRPLMMLLWFHVYLRPGEMQKLRVQDFFPPILGASKGLNKWSVILHPLELDQASKTQEFDETLTFDLNDFVFIAEAIHRWMKLGRRPKDEKIFHCHDCSPSRSHGRSFPSSSSGETGELLVWRNWGAAILIGEDIGGASHDFQTKARSLVEIQRRGRWKSFKSFRWYGGKSGSDVTRPTLANPESSRGKRKAHKNNNALPALSPTKVLVVAVFLEIFSGSGRLGKEVAQVTGWPTLLWDLELGEQYDLLVFSNRLKIRQWIKAGWIRGFHLGTPCESFTRARDIPPGPPPLRSDQQPLGLSDWNLTTKQKLWLEIFSWDGVPVCWH